MFKTLFSKPLELKVGDQVLYFSTVTDFDFCLAGRIAVPSRKITDLVKFSTEQLKKEARTIKDIEKRFVTILTESIEDNSSINRAMRELDPLIFSQDHSWREIIAALNNGGEELNEFRRIALAKYMQYLSSRQEIIKYLYNEKKKMLKEPSDIDALGTSEFKETLLLDNTVFEESADEQKQKKESERMPKGEAITVTLAPNEEMEIMLSKHKCKIIAKNGIQFTDQAGRTYTLQKGRNVVGRDTVSNIMMEPTLRDISRLHLVIENFGNNSLQLTDLSSHGTYIPPKFIEHRTSS
jgi:hypothetical protein